MSNRHKYKVWDRINEEWLDPTMAVKNIGNNPNHIFVQCTEFNDIEHNIIYEGDVCDGIEEDVEDGILIDSHPQRCVIVWSAVYGQWQIEDVGTGHRHPLYDYDPISLGEVIGNIYENPALIRGHR